MHHWKETEESDPEWADRRDVLCLEKKLIMSGIEREQWWPAASGGLHEVTFAVNLASGEWRMPDGLIDRDTWKAAFPTTEWLTGTIDWLAPGWLDDLKTGHWPVDPVTSKQLRSYALFQWLADGKPDDWGIEATITQWEKYPLHGLPRRSSHQLTTSDMIEHLDDLRWAVSHPGEVNPTTEGCMFCDSRPICPALADPTNEYN